jgi:hypothetical protein
MVIFTFLLLGRIFQWYIVLYAEVCMVFCVARGLRGRLCISRLITRLGHRCAHEPSVNIQIEIA